MGRITITAPESLEEVTLKQYQELRAIQEAGEEFIELRDIKTPLFLNKMLGFNEDILEKIPFVELEKLKASLIDMFEQEQKLVTRFMHNGIEFGMIPNLDDMSWGENDNLGAYVSDWSQMHKAMAVFYRPITTKKRDKYLIEEYKGTAKYAETMKGIPLAYALGAIVFFYNLANDLLNYIPSYLQKMEAKSDGFYTRQGRYHQVVTIAKGFKKSIETASSTNVHSAFRYLEYVKEKEIHDTKSIKK